jgi:hypothetical protein
MGDLVRLQGRRRHYYITNFGEHHTQSSSLQIKRVRAQSPVMWVVVGVVLLMMMTTTTTEESGWLNEGLLSAG